MRAYIDYLRLCTFDDVAYTKLIARTHTIDGKWRPGRFLQYAGQKSDHLFHGVGEQDHRRHCLVQASGDLAETFAAIALPYGQFYCTRIDIQRTIEKEQNYDPRPVYEDARSVSANRRNTSLVLSDTGSTIYFGNRSSDTFARLYEKEIGDLQFLRLEIEIKGITSRDAWDNIRDENMRAGEVYEHLFKRFNMPDYVADRFLNQTDVTSVYQLYERNRFKNSKLTWLIGLERTIVKMGNDHQTGSSVRTFLERCLEQIDRNTP